MFLMMGINKEELKLLFLFYLESFFGTAFYLLTPFLALYFNSIGLSAWQIGLLLGAWPLASLLFEIPGGAISDLYGRRAIVILGWALAGIGFIFMPFFSNFYSILVLFFFIGVFQTLGSGSYESLVVDILHNNKKKKYVGSFFVTRHSLLNLGFVVSGIVGGIIVANFGLKSIWIASGGAFLLSSFFIIFSKEYKNSGKKISLKLQIKQSANYAYKHPVLFYLLVYSLIWGIISAFESSLSWTPLLKSYNLKDSYFGYLWSAASIVGVIAPLLARRFIKNKKEKNSLIILGFVSVIFSFLVLVSNNIYIFVCLYLLGYFVIDFRVPVFNTYLHRHVSGNMRATVNSIQNFVYSLAGIIFFPACGFLIDKVGSRYVLFISGLLAIPTIILLSRINEKKI